MGGLLAEERHRHGGCRGDAQNGSGRSLDAAGDVDGADRQITLVQILDQATYGATDRPR